jgi:protein SCO1/2
MTAMTMPFEVKDTNELTGLKAGDLVTFHMVVTLDDGWIEKVVKIGTQTAPAPEPIRIMRDVEPLKEGDRLPDYRFTNELGQAVQLGQFKGQALVLAFFYTRCPYPDFCPRTSKNLAALVEQLKRRTDAPTNWHVLSLSFDPGFDTVPVLKAYARQYQADPRRWNFLTGAIAEIDAITEQFGMLIARGETGFDHNLRTVVVDATGKIQKIIPGNKWQPAELAGEVIKAAHPR